MPDDFDFSSMSEIEEILARSGGLVPPHSPEHIPALNLQAAGNKEAQDRMHAYQTQLKVVEHLLNDHPESVTRLAVGLYYNGSSKVKPCTFDDSPFKYNYVMTAANIIALKHLAEGEDV